MAGSYSHPHEGDLPVLFGLPALTIDSSGVINGPLTVVTEDGRQFRITGLRHPDGDVQRTEITVAEEES